MATIEDLPNPNFLKLSSPDRFALIRNLRAARRIAKEKPVKTSAKTALGPRAKRTKKTVMTGDLAGLSQEQLAQLMEMMENAD